MVLHPSQAALLGGHFFSNSLALPQARLGAAASHGQCPSFPGVVGLTKTTLHVQTRPDGACGGMLMAVRLVKV